MSDFDPIIKKISDYVQNYQANEESLQEAKTCFFDSIACAFMALEHDQVKKFIDIDKHYILEAVHPSPLAANRGGFLETSWRMPPVLTSLVSKLFYKGELKYCISKSENKIIWEGIKQGLSFVEVEHYSNASESKEEIDTIEELVNKLTGCQYQKVQKDT